MRLTVVAPSFLGRPRPFSHAPFEIFQIVVHLLKRESECKKAFRRIARKISRETVAADRSDLGIEAIKCRFDAAKRRRISTEL